MSNGQLPDGSEALDFLHKWEPKGPWVLIAIDPERKRGPIVKNFDKDNERGALAFIRHWNGKRNLYFSVNAPRELLTSKAEKKDIGWVVAFHVDVDPAQPPEGCVDIDVFYEEQRAVILQLLRAYTPKPSVIVFSGGGYQAYWLLKEPIEIESVDVIEQVEAINRRFEKDLDGDHCFNIDRIMRLPGTVNLPDEKKQKMGRKAALATVIDADWQLVYDTTLVDPWAEEKRQPAKSNRGGYKEHPLPEWAGRVLKNGPDHEGQRSYGGDRSRALWAVCCTMVRRNWSIDDIAIAILDKSNRISEHVYEQSNPEKYAERQAERAYEEAGGGFDFDKTGKPLCNQHNIRFALKHLDVSLSYDAFAGRQMIEGPDGSPFRVLNDFDLTQLYLMIDEQFEFRPPSEYFRDVISNECRANSYHPVQQYFDALNWDGTPRIDTWLIDCAGAPDTPFVRAASARVLMAVVRRVRQPGAKFDEVLILESEQGYDKSTAFRIMAIKDEWFTDSLPLNADDKVVIEQTAGKLLIEVSELKGIGKRDVEHLKAFTSRQADRARLAFGRITTEVPRQFVLVATTNSNAYLRDGTGNRRFWPIKVERFQISKLRDIRDQLWAEACAREADGESIRLPPELYEAAALEQERRNSEDPFVGILSEYFSNFDYGRILATDMWTLIPIPMAQRTQEHSARISEAMRKVGWDKLKLRVKAAEGQERKTAWYFAKGTVEERRRQIHVQTGDFGPELYQDEPSGMPRANMTDIPF